MGRCSCRTCGGGGDSLSEQATPPSATSPAILECGCLRPSQSEKRGLGLKTCIDSGSLVRSSGGGTRQSVFRFGCNPG